MKTNFLFTLVILTFFVLSGCKTTKEYADSSLSFSINKESEAADLKINFYKGEGFNHPTFAIWVEDMEGNYLKTLYVTKSFASGIFGHEMVGDTVWKRTSGPSTQPAALPYWIHKKGLVDGKVLIPTIEHPFVDAYTGATPSSNFELKAASNMTSKYRIIFEVNQAWDWNKYWTNNKFPGNTAYSHSAQPSVIYAVEINDDNNIFYLNPIGHGSPTGEDGKLYTDLHTLTTAKKIYDIIKIEIINK